MAIPISNVTRRVVYEADGTGPYAFTFEILANTDIAVYKDDALLTLTTDYTVTIASNGTGSITLVAAPTGADQIAIVGNRTIQRTTDFVTGGDFFANTVNNEMDQQTIFAQQNAEGLTRALQAPQTDPTTIDMTLPRASVRANKTLAFDTDGNPTTGEAIGDNRGNWASGTVYNKRDIVKDTSNGNIYYANTSHTSRNSQPISTNADSAKWDLLVDNASAGTSATNAANSATSAATSATNAASSATAAASSASSASSSASTATTKASEASTSATNAASSASTASTAATNASNSATSAATSATNASNSASAASTSASNASSSASAASTSASNASTSATNAASSASNASTSASTATTQATNAASSATAAAASAAAAAASFDAFDDIYLGAKSSDPSVDNDGNALTTGDQYFNTTANELRVYNGSTWQAASTVGGTVTSLSVTGATTLGQNLAFTGTGNRITGDFSNATVANRVMFQTNETNAGTNLTVIPNGTAGSALFQALSSSSDPNNCSVASFAVNSGTDVRIAAAIKNTGSYLPITLHTGGSEKMRVTTSGQVLVGASSGDAYNPLQLQSMLGFATTGGYYSEINNNLYYGSAAWRNKNQGPASQIVLDGGSSMASAIRFNISSNATSTAANTAISLSEAMRITAAGDVGIGTSSPGQKLDVKGMVRSSIGTGTGAGGAGYAFYQFGTSATATENWHIGTEGDGSFRFYNQGFGSGIERMRIDSSGRLLVGKTSTGDYVTGVEFQPAGAVLSYRSSGVAGIFGRTDNGETVRFTNNSNTVGSISTTGSATAYNTSSDYRLKHDIAPMIGALAKVAQLKPVTYKWNSDNSESQGFIAHELQEVVPECVTGEKDAVDAEGKPQYQGIDTSFLVATLTAAIQELKAEFDAYKATHP